MALLRIRYVIAFFSMLHALAAKPLLGATCTLSVVPASSPLTLVEGGSAVSLTVGIAGCPGSLNPPSGDVTVAITASSAELLDTYQADPVVIPAASFPSTVTMKIKALEDYYQRANALGGTLTFSATAYAPGDTIIPQTITGVVFTDNDTSALDISKSSLTTYSEGQSDGFTVRLKTIPFAAVTISATSSDAEQVSVTPASLTFDSSNWSQPQAFTARGGLQAITVSGTQTIRLTIASNDARYAALAPAPITVVHSPARLVYSKPQLQLSLGGGSDSFALRLAQAPSAPVTVGVTPRDERLLTVNRASLLFTPSNWQEFQTVTVTGADLDEITAAQSTAIDFSDRSADPAFNDNHHVPVSVRLTPSQLVFSKNLLTLSYAGSTDSLSLTLARQPTADVIVTLAADQPPFFSVSKPLGKSLTFTPTSWDVPQEIQITGEAEAKHAPATTTLALKLASGDAHFNNGSVPMPISKQPANFTLGKKVLATNDQGGSDSFTLALSRKPSADVEVVISRNTRAWLTVKPRRATFTPDTWQTPQTITVYGKVQEVFAPQTTTLSLVGSSADASYAISEAAVLTVRHEMAKMISISGFNQSLGAHHSASFLVGLKKAPSQTLQVTASAATEALTFTPRELSFDASNWQTPQLVTITRVNAAAPLPLTTVVITPSLTEEFSPVQATISSAGPVPTAQGLYLAHLSFGNGFYRTSSSSPELGIPEPPHLGQAQAFLLTEQGTAHLEIRLVQQPLAEVAVVPSLSDHGRQRFALQLGEDDDGPPSLVFTPQSWHLPQVVSLTVLAKDQGGEGAGSRDSATTRITFALRSQDPYYDGVLITSQGVNYQPAAVTSSTRRGCFIATAAFTDPNAPELQILQQFRDTVLLNGALGRAMVKAYYGVGPTLAGYIAPHPLARMFVRGLLYPIIWMIEQPMWLVLLLAIAGGTIWWLRDLGAGRRG